MVMSMCQCVMVNVSWSFTNITMKKKFVWYFLGSNLHSESKVETECESEVSSSQMCYPQDVKAAAAVLWRGVSQRVAH